MRYLFGPLPAARVRGLLPAAVQSGDCLAFDPAGDGALVIGPADTWAAVEARFPRGWRPDFVAVWGAYRLIPEAVWSAPVPVVLLAPDWELLWHHYREHAGWADLLATDPAGVARFHQAGVRSTRAVDLAGLPQSAYAPPDPAPPRDTDLLVVGNLNPVVLGEQTRLLAPLARLGVRWKVAFHSGPPDDEARGRMRRARLVLPLGPPADCVRAEREAAAAGAGVVRLAGTPAGVPGGVWATPAEVERVADELLRDEPGRSAAVSAAAAALADVSFAALWDLFVGGLAADWDGLRRRAETRPAPAADDALRLRCHQSLNARDGTDPTLVRDLELAARRPFPPPDLATALGVLRAREAGPGDLMRAVEALRDLAAMYPGHPLLGANLAAGLAAVGQAVPALDQARRTLAALCHPTDAEAVVGSGFFFPHAFDAGRVAWERAGWEHADSPERRSAAKADILRSRLHRLVAARTGDLTHHYEAHLSCPRLLGGAADLGLALVRSGQPDEACRHLAAAVAADPFDADPARAYHGVLGGTGRGADARALADDRRRLSAAFPAGVPPEPWFTEAPPHEADLASVIVPCFNECSYTRMCLESVFRHARRPFELVLIDNGSTDDTPAYLATLRGRPGPERVRVIRNDANRGFPGACNQGFAAARGRYLVLLNNDTVVTRGWLEGLVARAADPQRNVGLVGPVSNCAPDAQHVEGGYADPAGLEAFASRRAREFAGRTLVVRRLTGFCLLVRRDVLERVGGLDERFGLGFFDDDDLCFRAADGGFGLAVAQDVFVHHFGSRTFRSLGVDTRDLLETNFGRFRDKWGSDRTVGYRAPEPPPGHNNPLDPRGKDAGAPAPTGGGSAVAAGPRAGGRRRVSLSMIVRDEEQNLPDCLRCAADLFDEVVVVDTGSTDRTKESAAAFGVKLVDFPWVDSFAAARNESLRHCTGDWVMWLDADDRLDAGNRDRLRAVLDQLGDEVAAYAVKVRSVVDGGRSVRLLDQVRLFPRRPDVWWRYRIHEQILPAVAYVGGGTRWTDVVVDHVGYQDGGLRQKKLERNLRLLELERAEQPDDPFTLFNYGRTLLDLDRTAEALPAFQKSLAECEPGLSIVRKLYPLLAQSFHQLGQRAEALRVCREGQDRFPRDAELLFQQAQLHCEARDLRAAEGCLVQLLQSRPGTYFDMVDVGLRGYKARHQLGLVYQNQGRLDEAEAQWRSAAAERPDFAPALLALADHYLARGRWDRCEQVIGELAARAPDAVEGSLLRPQLALAQGDYRGARQDVEGFIARHPGDVRPRLMLTHILLREGRDWGAAERALREVLALAPDHPEARQNLAVLLHQQERVLGSDSTDGA